MRQSLVVANWKMNGSLASNQALLDAIKQGCQDVSHVQISICPPAVYLAQVSQLLTGSAISWGAQNVSHEAGGAFTGEIAVSMLAELQCCYVIIGHSERRSLYAESDQIVAEKFARVRNAGLIPILCVGETLSERESNQTETVVLRQLDAVLASEGIAGFHQAVIAYEPVWAIGTGKTASREQAQAVHAVIRQHLAKQDAAVAEKIQILYGGSVKANNATELFAMPDIDGGLIGGASLQAQEFLAICKAAR